MSFSVFKINLSLFVFLSTAFLSIDNGIAGDEEKNISFPNDALLQTTAIEDPASFIDHSSRESLLISEGSLAHLPTEIIFHIFKYLERADVVNLSQTSRTFRACLLEQGGIDITINGNSLDDFFEDFSNIQMFSHIRHLTLTGDWQGKTPQQKFHALFNKLNNIDGLFLKNITLDPLGSSCLSFLMPRTIKVLNVLFKEENPQTLSYNQRNVLKETIKNLCQMLPLSLKEFIWKNSLKEIDSEIPSIIPQTIEHLTINLNGLHDPKKIISQFPPLKSLTLYWDSGHFIDNFVNIGKNLPYTLKHFSLLEHNFDFPLKDLQLFVNSLPKNLETLDLSSSLKYKKTISTKKYTLDCSALPLLTTLKLEGLSIAPYLEIHQGDNNQQSIQNVFLFSPLFTPIIDGKKPLQKEELLALGWDNLNYLTECILNNRCPDIHPTTLYTLATLVFYEQPIIIHQGFESDFFVNGYKRDVAQKAINLMEIAIKKSPDLPTEELGKFYLNLYYFNEGASRIMSVGLPSPDATLQKASDLGCIGAKNVLAVFYLNNLNSRLSRPAQEKRQEALPRINTALALLLSIPDEKKTPEIFFNISVAYSCLEQNQEALLWLQKSADLGFDKAIRALES